MSAPRAGGRLAAAAAVLSVAAACGGPEPSPPPMAVEIRGDIRLPEGADPAARIYVTLYHAWSLTGELRHPLQRIEEFEATPGAFAHRLLYPVGQGEGLVVYAWADLDGDGVLCTPTERGDPAGLTEVAGFPAAEVSVTVDLVSPCRGPDWFYPPPPHGGS